MIYYQMNKEEKNSNLRYVAVMMYHLLCYHANQMKDEELQMASQYIDIAMVYSVNITYCRYKGHLIKSYPVWRP